MAAEIVLKSRMEAPDGVIYIYCLRVDLARKTINEVHGIAGDHHELSEQSLAENYSAFVNWMKTMEFNGRRDESKTYDLLRYFEKYSKNQDWLGEISGMLRAGDTNGLQYKFSQDFEIALGYKDLVMQYDLAEYVPPPSTKPGGPAEEDLSSSIPVTLVVSPFSGVPLIRLTPGDRVHLRFARPKATRTANYIKRMQVEARDGRYEVDARLLSLGTRPGKGDILLKFKLDGGAEAHVIEENQDIRVKMAERAGKSGSASSGRSRSGTSFETPAPIGAPLAAVLLFIIFIATAGLLFFFL